MSLTAPPLALPLVPAARHYAWGSPTALPALLGEEPDGRPLAELWFGAHPAGPATVRVDGADVSLDVLVAADREGALGGRAAKWSGRLPFMLKLIAAAEPLSIQVHPSADRARARFAAEAESTDEARYQDPHAKPEVVCALDPFDALIDFRSNDEVLHDLDRAGLVDIARAMRSHGLGAAVRQVLSAEGAATAGAIDSLVAAGDELSTRLAAQYPGDPGVVLAMFLNPVRLAPGEAAFLGPGTVHAYLGGLAVEVMGTSDNVLRAGLTSKLVDVDEFLGVARLAPCGPDLLHADGAGVYPARAEEFTLVRHHAADTSVVHGPAVVVCTSGTVDVAGTSLSPGRGAFVPAAAGPTTIHGSGEAYTALAGSDLESDVV
jgi:mannose-6-phosphate isomerase